MTLHFMKYRKLSYWISGLLCALSIFALATRGLNYGIDFAGGIAIEVAPKSAEYTIDKMRGDLSAYKPEMQAVGDRGAILVRVGLAKGATDEQQNQVVREIKDILADKVDYRAAQVVGPKIGNELIRGGIMAIIFSFLLMSIYIWIRYKGGYAVGSFVSLILDFVLMFGFFSVCGLEFNQTAIAVILMGLGYSTNDKVVNYDRIEENSRKYLKMPQDQLIDLSINEMMSRTVLTSVTTLLVMVAMYIFAGGILGEFAIAMAFAIIMGTITSIYVSNVILWHFNLRKDI